MIHALKMKSTAGVKYKWSEEEIQFLLDNWRTMTNRELADALQLTLTITRSKLYELGCKRQEMEYWTSEMVEYLKAHYKTVGDTEIAEEFQKRFPKKKPWSKKHIEKKRRYLKLKRTLRQRKAIRADWTRKGLYKESNKKMWATRGVASEGEIRYWKKPQTGKYMPVIKVDGRFVNWGNWRWSMLHGEVPKGMNVIFKDGDPYNRKDDNLILVTNAELAKINSETSSKGLSDNYVAGVMTHGNPELRDAIKQYPGLIKAKRAQLLLQREINNHKTK